MESDVLFWSQWQLSLKDQFFPNDLNRGLLARVLIRIKWFILDPTYELVCYSLRH